MKFRYNEINETSKSDHRAVFINCELQKANKIKEYIKKCKPWRLKNIILGDEIVNNEK